MEQVTTSKWYTMVLNMPLCNFSRSIRSFEIIGKNIKISETFSHWNEGKLASFLVELSAVITKNTMTKETDFFLKKYSTAPAKKEPDDGQLSMPMKRSRSSQHFAAVQARIFSENITLRRALEKQIPVLRTSPTLSRRSACFALFLAMISAYSEGFGSFKSKEETRGEHFVSEISHLEGGALLAYKF